MRPLALLLCLIFAVPVIAAKADVDANRQQLNQLIAQYWEYNLQQNPVFASIIGDKRYNDQLGSTSEKTILEAAGEREGVPQALRGHRCHRPAAAGRAESRAGDSLAQGRHRRH